MQVLVPIVLYGWLPLVLVIFRDLRGHRALATVYVFAWLFLPSTAIHFRSLPDYTKVSATSLGVVIAMLLFEPRRLTSFRPHWLDALMLTFCLAPIPSSVSNELGLWDGCSNVLKNSLTWGLPYLFGRMYFDSFDKVRTLAKAIFIGGLVYIPFCIVEMRMSPQFYNWIYGSRPRVSTLHARRYGGWRPTVFLETGLELGMWMTAASLLGFALWYSGALRKLWGIGTGGLLLVLLVTTLLCKSTGSFLLLIGGTGIFLVMRWFRNPWPVLCLVMVPLLYIPIRGSGLNDGAEIVALVDMVFGAQRAESLGFRFYNEDLLGARAWESPWVGWGGWSRERVLNEYGEDLTVLDGMWIGLFGKYGLLGLSSFFAAFLLAPTAACFRFARPRWRAEDAGPLLAVCLLLMLYMVDCLLNAMDNALYPLCLGAVTTVFLQPTRKLIGSQESESEEEDPTRLRRRRLWPPVPARPEGAAVGRSEQLVRQDAAPAAPS
jgi:hypothetical protein